MPTQTAEEKKELDKEVLADLTADITAGGDPYDTDAKFSSDEEA